MRALAVVSRGGSTEFAVYEDGVQVANNAIRHLAAELSSHDDCASDGGFRGAQIVDIIESTGVSLEKLDVAISVTMALLPKQHGAYLVTDEMLGVLSEMREVDDARKLGAFIVWTVSDIIADKWEIECLPIVVEATAQNELIPEAALTGISGVERSPVFHALSQRGAARSYASTLGRRTDELNLIIAHLGGEISVGAHEKGRVIDCNSPLDGEGPFSPRTSGTLPTDALLRLCYSGKYDMDEMLGMVERTGGLTAHLGIGRLNDVAEACAGGDERARFLVGAMALKVAREIGSRSASLRGGVDAIIFTGPWASFEEFTDEIRSHVEWIAPVNVYSWESDLRILAEVASAVFSGQEELLTCVC